MDPFFFFFRHQIPKQKLFSILKIEIVLLEWGGENQVQSFSEDSFLVHCSIIICLQNPQGEKWEKHNILLLFFYTVKQATSEH